MSYPFVRRGPLLHPSSDSYPSTSLEENKSNSDPKTERHGARKVQRSEGEARARSFEQSRRPGVPDTTVGLLANGGGRTRRQETWSRMRSWSANDCHPSVLTKQRQPSRTLGHSYGWRLESLDLAGVKVIRKRATSVNHDNKNSNMVVVSVAQLPELRRPTRLSLPAACYMRAGGSPGTGGSSGTEQSTTRRQRHSVAGWRPHHLTKTGSGAACVFSTAVISGAASAPNLTDIIPNTASISEGCGGVPPIRPLETLHNALSLRQIDSFLEHMARGFKTPANTPPRQPGGSRPSSPTDSIAGFSGWSDPPSFVSSSGASSPAQLPEFYVAQRFQQSGFDFYGHRDSIEVAELYSHSTNYQTGPQSFYNEASMDDRYFYDDSEGDFPETESTVVPSEDLTRAKLADIPWTKDAADDTPPAVPRSSGRFTCTSVDEETQLVTPSAANPISVGFALDETITPPTSDVPSPEASNPPS